MEEPIDASAEPPGEGPVSSRRTRQLAGHYGVAVVAVGLALLLQWLLFPLFGVEANASPFMMFFAAVMVAAWFGGLGSGLLATGCSALLSWYFFLSPQHPFAIATLGQGLRIIVFTLEGALISLLAGAMQSARRQAEASAQRTVKNQRKLFHNEERLRLALESTGLGTWDYDPASGEVRADDYAKAVLGVPPEAEVNYETFLAGIHPYDRERVEELVRRTTDVKNGGEYEVQYRTLGPEDGGAERWMEARGRAFFDKAGRAVRLVGTVLDVTERKRAEQEVRARARQQDAIAELGQRALSTTDLQSLFNDAVESVAGVLEVEYAKVLELLPGGEELLVRAGVGWKQDIVGRARVSCSRESWAGYTLLTEEPVIVSDLRSETRFAGAPLLHEHGVVSGMTAIINPGGQPFGVLGAHTTERKQYTDDDANFLRAAANVLAAAIQRNQAEEAQRFLAEVGALLSSSLDYRTTLTSMARLVVPTLADWCAIDLLSEDGSAERLAVEHQDRERVPLALRLQERYPHDPNATSGVPNVLRTGCPEFYPEITDEMLQAAARDEEHLMLLRKIGFTSAVIVPMVARGRTLGALTWVSSESGRRYAESDLELAEELARRAALTIDNARLYEEAQRELAEREWAQAELRSSRDELEVILGGIADGVTAQDRTGRVIYANEAAARMVGYPSGRAFMEAAPHEMMERFQVLDEEGYPFPLEDLPGRRALRGQEGAEEVLRFRMLATGEERWALIKALPVFDERGGGPHGGEHLPRHNGAQANRRRSARNEGSRAPPDSPRPARQRTAGPLLHRSGYRAHQAQVRECWPAGRAAKGYRRSSACRPGAETRGQRFAP